MSFRHLLVAVFAGLLALGCSTVSFGQSEPANSIRRGSMIVINDCQVKLLHQPAQIAAQADGLVKELLVSEGSRVNENDQLLVIDDRVAAAEVAVAAKELEAAEKQASQTAHVQYAEKAAEVADAEYADAYDVYHSGAGNFTEARRKKLEAEKARLGIDVSIVEHEKEVLARDVAKEKLNAAKIKLDLYKVLAPRRGIIVEQIRDQGEWIRAGEPVLKLAYMDEMRVEALVPVDGISVANLQGAPMKITIPANLPQNIVFESKVEFVSPIIEFRNVRVWAKVPNTELGGQWILRDGMKATVEIPIP
ncbi:MAG: HlyD family efflux transporter periplasmic adaptor subunit [Planctomycetales bacterium]|nr:HlyD family efflux transporter periplasmic adaptor subunit [Planctomycetales bacterium]